MGLWSPHAVAVDRNCYPGQFCAYKDYNVSQANYMYKVHGR